MRKQTILLLTLSIVLLTLTPSAQARIYSGGGTELDPFIISTAAEMNDIGNNSADWDKHFKLTTDIDLSAYTGTSFNIIGNTTIKFTGVFDGNDHVISNFSYDIAGVDYYIGLFAYVDGQIAEIKNLGLIDPNVQAQSSKYVGSLVGSFHQGTIIDCYVNAGTVSGDSQVGGLIGDSQGSIIDCYVDIETVFGKLYIGGLAGVNGGIISNCRSTAIIKPTGYKDKEYFGGLVGYNWGTIVDSNASGSVDGIKMSNFCGGLVGGNKGQILGCSATGKVLGYASLGGLIGLNGYKGEVHSSYATGDVQSQGGYYPKSSMIGGLIGDCDDSGTITNCWASGKTDGAYFVGGLIGRIKYGQVRFCYATGDAYGGYEDGYDVKGANVGGLIGSVGDSCRIQDCYSTGNAIGPRNVGGLIGYSEEAVILRCYSIGIPASNDKDEEYNISGLIGNNIGRVINSYWDTQTSGLTNSAGGIGKTTSEMFMASTFTGWGCDLAWTINEANDYPKLAWQSLPGSLITLSDPNVRYGGGAGTKDDPYLIYTPEQLNKIGLIECDLDKSFKLMSDIDLTNLQDTRFNIIGVDCPFTGIFDGNDHTISNFSYTTDYIKSCVGLFGCIDSPAARIRNLGLLYPNIEIGTKGFVGSMVGRLESGSLHNCYAKTASISTSKYTDSIGGLVGYVTNGEIYSCYSTGTVAGGTAVGGLVGRIYKSDVINCYSITSVTGENSIGGLVGANGAGNIYKCYSAGFVSPDSSHSGGLTGGGLETQVTDSFWDIETSGQETSRGGIGKTTNEMQTKNTFTDAGWNFERIWTIDEGNDYPRLTMKGSIYFACTGYEVVWEKRLSRTEFEYCLRMKIKNLGDNALEGITVELKSVSANTTILNNKVFFSAIPPGGEVLSEDTFIVKVDRSVAAYEDDIIWEVSDQIEGDFSGDGQINFIDFGYLADKWLQTGAGMAEDLYRDEIINFIDFAIFAENRLRD